MVKTLQISTGRKELIASAGNHQGSVVCIGIKISNDLLQLLQALGCPCMGWRIIKRQHADEVMML